MELALLVYFCQTVSSITGFFFAVAGFLIFAAFIAMFIWALSADKTTDVSIEAGIAAKKYFFRLVPAAALSLFIACVLPSEKTSYTMTAAYAAQKVALDPRTQEVGGKVLAILNKKLDIYLAEATNAANSTMKSIDHSSKN